MYRYDAAVQNHKQLAEGDLVLIRDSDHLVGLAQVEKITSSTVSKVRQRCPTCGKVTIKLRKSFTPPWRCSAGHEFQLPVSETISLVGYEAHYGQTFVATPRAIPVEDIKAAARRPSDQLSIEEIDIASLEARLCQTFPQARNLIARFSDSCTLRQTDAIERADETPTEEATSFIASMCDSRASILRAIRVRRGQRTFRDKLIKRYGGRCVVSGCRVLDILEAAHISPYLGAADNHPQNGLLLRADLHTLFDLNLMAIEPASLVIKFHPKVRADGYAQFEGSALQFDGHAMPAAEPIARRWEVFLKGLEQTSNSQ
ncbi:HNH endonuclease [Burkholderia multivorans]|uniref:HNH endonuclease n=1 Tax=Burkholderia multivorans TaxID=87883 RepID=UPI0020A03D6C|nr:HNH endonuclease signature motif containing protein [Burkholderia multivorans]MCO8624489.1 HNH endonuclease [Burkholderia multivorans]